MTKEQTLTVPGRYEEIRGICAFVGAGAIDAGLDEDTVFQIELSCDEAATNIIEHAYAGENAGPIIVSYLATDSAFTFTLRDKGRPFDPASVPPPPTVATETVEVTPDELGSQLQVGGLGLHMIRNMMDDVYFSFDTEQGNSVVMVKRIGEGDKR